MNKNNLMTYEQFWNTAAGLAGALQRPLPAQVHFLCLAFVADHILNKLPPETARQVRAMREYMQQVVAGAYQKYLAGDRPAPSSIALALADKLEGWAPLSTQDTSYLSYLQVACVGDRDWKLSFKGATDEIYEFAEGKSGERHLAIPRSLLIELLRNKVLHITLGAHTYAYLLVEKAERAYHDVDRKLKADQEYLDYQAMLNEAIWEVTPQHPMVVQFSELFQRKYHKAPPTTTIQNIAIPLAYALIHKDQRGWPLFDEVIDANNEVARSITEKHIGRTLPKTRGLAWNAIRTFLEK